MIPAKSTFIPPQIGDPGRLQCNCSQTYFWAACREYRCNLLRDRAFLANLNNIFDE